MPRITPPLLALAALCLASPAALAQEAPAPGHSKLECLQTDDIDLDGIVTQAEYMARRGEAFARTDQGGDGVLSEAEYVAEYAERLDAQLAAQRERQIRQAHVRFGVMDTDRDRAMTRAEYDATAGRTFQRLDTNGDGQVDDRDTAQGH
jgi:esterase/lipase superfamily enzyme